MRFRQQTWLRIFAALMLAITFNNVLAVEHLLPLAYGAAGHTEPNIAGGGEAFVMPDPTEPGAAHEGHAHKHKPKASAAGSWLDKPNRRPVEDARPERDRANETHSHTHVQHCHVSPSTCSDQPVPSGPGQMLFAEPLLPALNLRCILIDESSVMPTVLALDTLTPPPRA